MKEAPTLARRQDFSQRLMPPVSNAQRKRHSSTHLFDTRICTPPLFIRPAASVRRPHHEYPAARRGGNAAAAVCCVSKYSVAFLEASRSPFPPRRFCLSLALAVVLPFHQLAAGPRRPRSCSVCCRRRRLAVPSKLGLVISQLVLLCVGRSPVFGCCHRRCFRREEQQGRFSWFPVLLHDCHARCRCHVPLDAHPRISILVFELLLHAVCDF
jgi:hypothetical protein